MRTQAAGLVDTAKLKEVYAIKVFFNGKWCFAGENGKPFLFDTAAERDAKRAEIRKLKP